MEPERRIRDAFAPLLDPHINHSAIGTPTYPIPVFNPITLELLCEKAIDSLKGLPNVLRLTGPTVIVGDIHGNLHDLIRIMASMGNPATTKYLFLGDYVDRGSYSAEVLSLLFALRITFPDTFFLIRGNHEYKEVNTIYGFKSQMEEYYTLELFEKFNQVFEYLPLAAVIGDRYFCVHGGISPSLKKVSHLDKFDRLNPIGHEHVIEDMMWSDPCNQSEQFVPSLRGKGVTFGFLPLKEFLNKNSMDMLIRAHQCVKRGVSKDCGGMVITVFSTSNYCNENHNYAGVIEVKENMSIESASFKMIEVINRADASTKNLDKVKKIDTMAQLKSVTSSQQFNLKSKTPSFLRCRVTHKSMQLPKWRSSSIKTPPSRQYNLDDLLGSTESSVSTEEDKIVAESFPGSNLPSILIHDD